MAYRSEHDAALARFERMLDEEVVRARTPHDEPPRFSRAAAIFAVGAPIASVVGVVAIASVNATSVPPARTIPVAPDARSVIERCATDIVAIAEARHVGLRNGTLPPNADELVVSTEVTCGTDLDAFIVRGSLFEHERAALERWIATENKLANTAWYVERRYGNEPQRADNTVSDLVWGDYRRALEDHTDAVRSWQRWYARR